ncbi:MAG: bacteriohemerythrin [Gammaproteobacteria bacterium]|nr:bacteriohemerythrin [Gammaproteobacteria bacterium]
MSEKIIDIFPWNKHFFTGISLVDQHHQKLVNILNRLANRIAFQSSKDEIHGLFDELSDYVIYHFDAEEKIWNAYLEHDDLSLNHKDEHQQFSDQLAQLKHAIDAKPEDELLSSTLRFLTRWLVSHILKNDLYMAYVIRFIKTGSTTEQAKTEAVNKINDSMKSMIDFILTIYETLSNNTFHLVQEIHHLAEKDKQLLFITKHIPVFIAYSDQEARYRFVNQQYAELYGYDPAAIVGLHARDVLGEKLYADTKQYITRVLSGEKVRFIRHQDKAPLDILVNYVPEFDANNNVTGFIASLVDISERFETERFEQFYTSILELLTSDYALDAILNEIIKGLEKLYPEMLCSINLLDKTGHGFEKVIAPSLPELCNKGAQDGELAACVHCCDTSVATGKITIAEDIMSHPDCALFKYLAQSANLASCWSHPIISNINDVLGAFTIYHRGQHTPSDKDISLIERCAHLASIAITNCRYRQQLQIAATAFENEQEGMMIVDTNLRIIQVNKAFKKITGYSNDEIIGALPNKLSSGQHDKQFYADMWRDINQNGTWAGEIYNRRKNGEIYPEFLRISAVYDSDHTTVVNYVATFSDMTSDKKAEETIERLAFFDPLTGLPNRRLTHERLERALSVSSRNNSYGFLILIDIDKFKLFNEIHNHAFGDAFLCQFVSRLQLCLREQDTLSRMGGDEFAIILEQLSTNKFEAIEHVNTIVEKILATMNEEFDIDDISCSCTLSIGITLFINHTLELSELLKQVDIALVHAKNIAGNSYSFFDPQMQEMINNQIMLETALSNAIKSDQLELYLQSQVDQTGKIVGAEALIRWNHPEQGLINPADFIPLAEETGLIIPLGEWVLNEGCRQLQCLQQNENTQTLTLSINVSAKQFYQDNFSDVVKSAIKHNDINPEQLKLELTESILVTNIDKTVAVMNELASLGIKFSMDDFGTGYSSLQYLSRLPLNQLKIDQSFVRDIHSNNHNLVITRTIIAMAKNLGLDVIAEGVETLEQREALFAEGCTNYQGYLFNLSSG